MQSLAQNRQNGVQKHAKKPFSGRLARITSPGGIRTSNKVDRPFNQLVEMLFPAACALWGSLVPAGHHNVSNRHHTGLFRTPRPSRVPPMAVRRHFFDFMCGKSTSRCPLNRHRIYQPRALKLKIDVRPYILSIGTRSILEAALREERVMLGGTDTSKIYIHHPVQGFPSEQVLRGWYQH